MRGKRAPAGAGDAGVEGIFVRLAPEVPLNAAKPQLLLRRPTFSALPEKVGKKRRWIRIGLYRKPQNEPVEKHCSQHTEIFLQSYTTAPPAWNNAPIGSSFHAGRWQNTLLWNAEHIYGFADSAQYLRSIVHVCRGRCPHRPAQCAPFLRKSAANLSVPIGLMWASAPTNP